MFSYCTFPINPLREPGTESPVATRIVGAVLVAAGDSDLPPSNLTRALRDSSIVIHPHPRFSITVSLVSFAAQWGRRSAGHRRRATNPVVVSATMVAEMGLWGMFDGGLHLPRGRDGSYRVIARPELECVRALSPARVPGNGKVAGLRTDLRRRLAGCYFSPAAPLWQFFFFLPFALLSATASYGHQGVVIIR